jgi:hypothetical protein
MPAKFEAFAERIGALRARLQRAEQESKRLITQQGQVLGDLAVASLEQQQERIATYLVQVRLAVAQLYDQSAEKSSGPTP